MMNYRKVIFKYIYMLIFINMEPFASIEDIAIQIHLHVNLYRYPYRIQ